MGVFVARSFVDLLPPGDIGYKNLTVYGDNVIA